jgi:AcrR family transcriptional regulator
LSIQNKQEMLLHTAIDLFFQKGYSDTSIRDIGAKAGISTSIIYHYFKNKEELLFEIIHNASQDIIKNLRAIEKRIPDPVECLREMLISNTILFTIKRKKEFKIIASERYYLKGKRREITRKMQREIWDIYFKKLQAMAEKGVLNDMDLRVMNFCISSVLIQFLNWYREEGSLLAEEVIQNIIKFVFIAILKEKQNYMWLIDRKINIDEVNVNLGD